MYSSQRSWYDIIIRNKKFGDWLAISKFNDQTPVLYDDAQNFSRFVDYEI